YSLLERTCPRYNAFRRRKRGLYTNIRLGISKDTPRIRLERYIIGGLSPLTIAARPVGRLVRFITLFTLRITEKRDLFRDDLHDLMLRSGSILVLARLNASLNGYKPAAVDVVGASLRQPVEGDYRKPGDLFPLFAVCLPLLVNGD